MIIYTSVICLQHNGTGPFLSSQQSETEVGRPEFKALLHHQGHLIWGQAAGVLEGMQGRTKRLLQTLGPTSSTVKQNHTFVTTIPLLKDKSTVQLITSEADAGL